MKPSRILRILFVGSLLAPLGLALIMSVRGRAYTLLYTFLILYALAGYCLIAVLARRGKGEGVFLLLAVLNVLLLTPELILRKVGFQSELGVQFGYPEPTTFETFLPDEQLFWRLPPNQDGTNALGFRGRDWVIPKPPDVYRVMFLGDSVLRAYPGLVELILNADRSRTEFVETLNLSVEGYSSYQGRILTDRLGAVLEPDLVIVSFGWNDHWQAYGNPDAAKHIDMSANPIGGGGVSPTANVAVAAYVAGYVTATARPASLSRGIPGKPQLHRRLLCAERRARGLHHAAGRSRRVRRSRLPHRDGLCPGQRERDPAAPRLQRRCARGGVSSAIAAVRLGGGHAHT